MKPKLTVIDSPAGISELIEYLRDKDLVAYDCETTGVHAGAEVIGVSVAATLTEAFYVILSVFDTETQTLVHLENHDYILPLIELLKTKRIIAHNGVFDCQMAENFFKVRLIESLFADTMIMAHLLNENRRVGLKELAKEYYGEDSTKEAEAMRASVIANGGKWTSKDKEMYKADPFLMGEYGAQDALLTLKVYYTQLPQLKEQKLAKFFFEDESMPLLRGPTYDLNTAGLRVDVQSLLSLKKTLEAECLEAREFIYKEIHPHIKDKYPGNKAKNTFNIGSSSQLSWLLFGKLELEFGTLTKGGKAVCKALEMKIPYHSTTKRHFIKTCLHHVGTAHTSAYTHNGKKRAASKIKEPWGYIACDKKTLSKLAPRYKWIEKLLEYQRKNKILTTYIKGIEERLQYGIIRPSFLQHGTTSGRYASRNPNFQNLPRDDKRVKACIVPRAGKVFVGADYSQLEPRVFAYFSGDVRLLQAFRGEDDFYSVIGMEVYDKTDCTPRKEGSPDAFGIKYKRLRDLSKVIALASTYGATAHQLAPTTGKSIEDTQQDIDNYFERFPGVKNMMLESHAQAMTGGAVYNLFGRPRRMPEAKKIKQLFGNMSHAELPYEARNLLNLAVNHRIQSTGASVVNRGAIKFYEYKAEAGIDCKLVLQVHDSLIVECNEADAEDVVVLLQAAMENTVELEGVKLEAVPKIGNNLSTV